MRLVSLLCLFLPCVWSISAVIKSVYDGDTVKVDLVDPAQCIPTVFSKDLLVRVKGIDTPELRANCRLERCLALKAKEFTESALTNSQVAFNNEERDKYFRLLADINYKPQAENSWKLLSDEIIQANLAVAYFGKTKVTDWCDYSQNTVFYEHTVACLKSDPCVKKEYEMGRPLTSAECKQSQRTSLL